MNKIFRFISIFIALVVFAGCTSQADCQLDVAKNAKTEIAARIGANACEEKYGK
jgi:PBP1b-binding outer membrane lipoprotein LpoB